jgi:hypothetical protein
MHGPLPHSPMLIYYPRLLCRAPALTPDSMGSGRPVSG